MITHTDFKQNSVEWKLARAGIPTASEFDALVSPEFKIRTGEGPKTYLAKKIAEAWQGGPLDSYTGFDMDQGHILEEEAIPWFEFQYNIPVQKVAFITTDDKRIGCSPDGLLGEDSGLEIKCPTAHIHTSYVLKGTLPKDYAAQVHGAMFVTGRKQWQFVSYRRNFPALVLTVERDEEIQERLAEALESFLEQFDHEMERMTEINGGPPHRLTPFRGMTDLSGNERHLVPGTPS